MFIGTVYIIYGVIDVEFEGLWESSCGIYEEIHDLLIVFIGHETNQGRGLKL